MNTFLLLKAKSAILAAPEHFSMREWDCGSTACIAGWVARIAGIERRISHLFPTDLVRAQLKLNWLEFDRLSLVSAWPSDLGERFSVAEIRNAEFHDNDPELAEIAAERIDRFIATDGRE
jgi:hypothetical protein